MAALKTVKWFIFWAIIQVIFKHLFIQKYNWINLNLRKKADFNKSSKIIQAFFHETHAKVYI